MRSLTDGDAIYENEFVKLPKMRRTKRKRTTVNVTAFVVFQELATYKKHVFLFFDPSKTVGQYS